MKLFTLTITTIVAAVMLASTDVSAQGADLKDQQVYFQATQTVTGFLTCVVEASNADEDVSRSLAAEQCFRDKMVPDVQIDFDGIMVSGIDTVVGFFVYGPGATDRTNQSLTQGEYLAEIIEPGPLPGTGTIRVSFLDSGFYSVVKAGPFGDVGTIFISDRDIITLSAETPGNWRITDVFVRRLVTEPRPNVVFPDPYPAFGVQPAPSDD